VPHVHRIQGVAHLQRRVDGVEARALSKPLIFQRPGKGLGIREFLT
jgi:hypothetical protein